MFRILSKKTMPRIEPDTEWNSYVDSMSQLLLIFFLIYYNMLMTILTIFTIPAAILVVVSVQ